MVYNLNIIPLDPIDGYCSNQFEFYYFWSGILKKANHLTKFGICPGLNLKMPPCPSLQLNREWFPRWFFIFLWLLEIWNPQIVNWLLADCRCLEPRHFRNLTKQPELNVRISSKSKPCPQYCLHNLKTLPLLFPMYLCCCCGWWGIH